jgi:hypothetical protein
MSWGRAEGLRGVEIEGETASRQQPQAEAGSAVPASPLPTSSQLCPLLLLSHDLRALPAPVPALALARGEAAGGWPPAVTSTVLAVRSTAATAGGAGVPADAPLLLPLWACCFGCALAACCVPVAGGAGAGEWWR